MLSGIDMNFPSLHDSQIERVKAKELKLCECCRKIFVRDETPIDKPEVPKPRTYAEHQWAKIGLELGKIQ